MSLQKRELAAKIASLELELNALKELEKVTTNTEQLFDLNDQIRMKQGDLDFSKKQLSLTPKEYRKYLKKK